MVYLICGICCCLSNLEDIDAIHSSGIYCVIHTACLFDLIWDILGAIVFCGIIYEEDICNKNISTYIFVSSIIKLSGNLMTILYLQQIKNKKKLQYDVGE